MITNLKFKTNKDMHDFFDAYLTTNVEFSFTSISTNNNTNIIRIATNDSIEKSVNIAKEYYLADVDQSNEK